MMDGNRFSCRTCKFWDRRYQENKGLGACERIGIVEFLEPVYTESPAISIHVNLNPFDDSPPMRESIRHLRTVSDFGCVGWRE